VNNDAEVTKISKVRGLIVGLIISIGGFFATFLAFAVVYTAYKVFFSNDDLHAPDPFKLKLKMITFAVGLVFPFIAGYYCGRKNMGIKTYTHYILATFTGLYVFYLAEGQANVNLVLLLSLMGILFVLSGFYLASYKTRQTNVSE